MKMLFWLLIILVSVLQVQAQSAEWQEWQKRGQKKPNLLPMYGGKPTSKSMQAADQKFLATMDKQGGTRAENSREYSDFGWQHIKNRDVITAMYRFNQAWLLDSTNAEAYHGFGFIAGMFEAFEESFGYYNKGLSYDSTNIGLLNDYVFMILIKQKTSPSVSDIAQADKLSRHSLSVNPNHAYTPQLISKILFRKSDYVGAWENLYLSKKNGSKGFDQNFIKDLHAQMPDPKKEFVQ